MVNYTIGVSIVDHTTKKLGNLDRVISLILIVEPINEAQEVVFVNFT